MDTPTTRRTCFIEEDDGLASIADIEAGFSGNHYHHFYSRPICYTASQRRNSLNRFPISSSSSSSSYSPRSVGRFYNGRFEEPQQQQQTHFLEACFFCKKQLGDNRDIFMYRGDTPFCSEECRQEQIDIDEAKEKNRNRSDSMKAMRKDQKNSNSPNKTQDYPCRTGAVAAA